MMIGVAPESSPPSPLGSGVESSGSCMGGKFGGARAAIRGLRLRLVLSLSRRPTSSPLSVKVSLSGVSFEGLGVGEKPPLLGEAELGGICVLVACASDTCRGEELEEDVVVDRVE